MSSKHSLAWISVYILGLVEICWNIHDYLSLFLSSCARFLVFVFLFLHTKYCPRHVAHLISNLYNNLARQVLPWSFYIWGNWGFQSSINFSKVAQQITGWLHFSREVLTLSLISKVSALSSIGLPVTDHVLLYTTIFAWIPVEIEGVLKEGQSWVVLPRSWHERLKPGTEAARRVQGR